MTKQNNTPTLRFPEFTGEWQEKKLGEIASNKSGKFNPEKSNEFVKCIELEHLASETGQLLGFVNGNNSGSIKNKFKKGDVLFGKLRPYLKKYLLAPFEGVCSSEIWVLNGISISNDFLFRIIQTEKFIDLANQSSGSKMPRADWSVVSSGLFKFPSLPEQTKIANFLTAVDTKISQLKKKKELLEQYKKGVMQKIFNCELRFTNDDGTAFPEWEEKKFSEYIKLYRGSSPRPIVRFITESADGINWIKIGDTKNVEDYIIKTVSEKITIAGSLQSRKVEVGELILANSMSFGKTYKLNISGCIYDGWFVLREYEKFFDKSFLMQLLNSEFMQKQYKTLSTGGVVQNISSDIVYSTNLLKPSLPEQTKIANFLSAIDEKITNVELQITKMEGWKKGLLQGMFV